MTDNNEAKTSYSDFVASRVKPGMDIYKDITPNRLHLIHMAMGVSGEAGELLDAVKKHCIYNKPLDRDNVIEELGDLEFYMEGLRASLKISRGEVLKANIEKLSQRYKQKYTDAEAAARADKEPGK